MGGLMRIKVIDEKKHVIHDTELPGCKAFEAWDAYDFTTFRKPYILKHVDYVRDHSNNRDEIVITVSKLTICGMDV
jgi:hypothetical protein